MVNLQIDNGFLPPTYHILTAIAQNKSRRLFELNASHNKQYDPNWTIFLHQNLGPKEILIFCAKKTSCLLRTQTYCELEKKEVFDVYLWHISDEYASKHIYLRCVWYLNSPLCKTFCFCSVVNLSLELISFIAQITFIEDTRFRVSVNQDGFDVNFPQCKVECNFWDCLWV